MIPPGSRYENAEHIFTQAHLYNDFGYPYLEDDAPNLKIATVNRETTYLVTTLPFPPDPVQEYYAKQDESMQWLAWKFLNDPNRWTELADANATIWYPLDLKMADYLRVPPAQ